MDTKKIENILKFFLYKKYIVLTTKQLTKRMNYVLKINLFLPFTPLYQP